MIGLRSWSMKPLSRHITNDHNTTCHVGHFINLEGSKTRKNRASSPPPAEVVVNLEWKMTKMRVVLWNFNSLLMCFVLISFHLVLFHFVLFRYVFAHLEYFARGFVSGRWPDSAECRWALSKLLWQSSDSPVRTDRGWQLVHESHRHFFQPARLQDGLFAILTSSCSLRVHVLASFFFSMSTNTHV